MEVPCKINKPRLGPAISRLMGYVPFSKAVLYRNVVLDVPLVMISTSLELSKVLCSIVMEPLPLLTKLIPGLAVVPRLLIVQYRIVRFPVHKLSEVMLWPFPCKTHGEETLPTKLTDSDPVNTKSDVRATVELTSTVAVELTDPLVLVAVRV